MFATYILGASLLHTLKAGSQLVQNSKQQKPLNANGICVHGQHCEISTFVRNNSVKPNFTPI